MALYSWFNKQQREKKLSESTISPNFTTDSQTWPIAKVNRYHKEHALASIKFHTMAKLEKRSTSLIIIDEK